ncbi:MAG: Arm DNA-binding domain-containing protein [Hassallia sp.]
MTDKHLNKNTTNRVSKGKAKILVFKGYLRIQFPRHLYNGKQKYLSTGLADTPENRSRVEAKLFTIQRDIDYNEFDATLEKYSTVAKINSATSITSIGNPNSNQLTTQEIFSELTVKQMLEVFSSKYFLTRKRNRQSEYTFKQHNTAILRAFNFKDNLDFYLSKQDVDEAIALTKSGSSMRIKIVSSLKVFCKKFKFHYNFEGLTQGYEPVPRNLPTDEEITEAWQKIQVKGRCCPKKFLDNTESWGWIFGVIATYGLRSHEVLAIDYNKSFKPPFYQIYIDDLITEGTKTGSRVVFPLPIEWVEQFDLSNPKTSYIEKHKDRFKINIKGFSSLFAERVDFKGITFPPYNLRHRYAVRGHELGFPIDDMARWMGHSVTMHTQTYQKYLGESTHFIAYEDGLRRMEALQKIKDGCPSYAELEAQLEKANNRIALLESELALREALVENKLLPSTQAQVSSKAGELPALNKAPRVLRSDKNEKNEIANQLKLF